MTLLTTLIGTLLFAVAGPVVGCLLAGLDRIISARMQGRVGPPLLQPYYDVRKLFEKERVSVNSVEGVYVACALLFALIAGGIFYSGGNLLLCVFVITLSSLFFIMAAYSTRSPYAEMGAARETLQVMSYEPMVLLMAVAFFQAAGSFDVAEVFQLDHPIICTIWLVFLGVLFILTIKLRKSPFDLSMSHHAHQEIVRGMTTEMSGPDARHGGDHALVRERAVPRLDRHVLPVGEPRLRSGRHRHRASGVLPGDLDRQQLRAREVAVHVQVGVARGPYRRRRERRVPRVSVRR